MKKRYCVTALVLGAFMAWGAGEARPDLVAKVEKGELKEARASWWGFDAKDSTRFLQAAINSRVPWLIVDKMPSPWMVLPLKGVSNQTLFFEPGSVVCAKRGEYMNPGNCLFTFRECENITLSGYKATLRMWHEDYMKPPYPKSEWRHILAILSSRNVLIEGLTVASSGGDGIYIGSTERKLCKCVDVVIRDVLCDDNHRQGISIITAENLLIENTIMRNTYGTAPAAGIDFEPNRPNEELVNCVMRNCQSINNQGAGYTTWAGQMKPSSRPLDIHFENCYSKGNQVEFSFSSSGRHKGSVSGLVTLKNCRFEKPKGSTISLHEDRSGAIQYKFENTCIVETNKVGQDVVTWLDDAWQSKHLALSKQSKDYVPHCERPNLALAKVCDNAPGKMLTLSPLRVRGLAIYTFYVDAPREVHFEGRQYGVGRYSLGTKSMVITNQKGENVAKIPVPGLKKVAFGFKAPAAGFYTLTIDMGQTAFCLQAADVPVAIDNSEDIVNVIYSEGSLWFNVTPEIKTFATCVAGEGVEKVTTSLFNPAGKQVAREENLGTWCRVVQKGDNLQGLWRIAIQKPSEGCFEDVMIDIEGLPAFFFLNPERTWQCPQK